MNIIETQYTPALHLTLDVINAIECKKFYNAVRNSRVSPKRYLILHHFGFFDAKKKILLRTRADISSLLTSSLIDYTLDLESESQFHKIPKRSRLVLRILFSKLGF